MPFGIGEYELEEEIGQRWGVARTWRGRSASGELAHVTTCPTVVTSEYATVHTVDLGAYVASLREPSIDGLEPYRVCELEGGVGIVRRWLGERLVDGGTSRARIAALLGELAARLERAASLPELSLHPDNVWIDDGRAILVDWGVDELARAAHAPTGSPVTRAHRWDAGLHLVPAGPPGAALARAFALTYAYARGMTSRDEPSFTAWMMRYIEWQKTGEPFPWDGAALDDDELTRMAAVIRARDPGSAVELLAALQGAAT